jgi:hypothetical protein
MDRYHTDVCSLIKFYYPGIPNLVVVTLEEPPYVMLDCPECVGNRQGGAGLSLVNKMTTRWQGETLVDKVATR